MTSKEALKQIERDGIFIKVSYGKGYVIDSKRTTEEFSKFCNIIKQDLIRLEKLEEKDKKWQELFGCNLCEALGRELLREENEKLKQENRQLKNELHSIYCYGTGQAKQDLLEENEKLKQKLDYINSFSYSMPTYYRDIIKEVIENE